MNVKKMKVYLFVISTHSLTHSPWNDFFVEDKMMVISRLKFHAQYVGNIHFTIVIFNIRMCVYFVNFSLSLEGVEKNIDLPLNMIHFVSDRVTNKIYFLRFPTIPRYFKY
jgi:hypothetical protein